MPYSTVIEGIFASANFHYLASEPSAEMFVGSNIRIFNARKPHPPIALHVKYRCVGSILISASSVHPRKTHLTKIYVVKLVIARRHTMCNYCLDDPTFE